MNRKDGQWVLQRWRFPAALYRKWRHRDTERSLRSDERRSVRPGGVRPRVDDGRIALLGMFDGRSACSQWTLFRQVRVSTARQRSVVWQRKVMLRKSCQVSGGGLHVRQWWAEFLLVSCLPQRTRIFRIDQSCRLSFGFNSLTWHDIRHCTIRLSLWQNVTRSQTWYI